MRLETVSGEDEVARIEVPLYHIREFRPSAVEFVPPYIVPNGEGVLPINPAVGPLPLTSAIPAATPVSQIVPADKRVEVELEKLCNTDHELL